MPMLISGNPAQLLEQQIQAYSTEIARSKQSAEYAREDATRFDADAERLTAERTEYQAALTALLRRKEHTAGTVTVKINADTSSIKAAVAEAKAAAEQIQGYLGGIG